MKRRLLSVLLCVCMVLTLTPTVAFAASGQEAKPLPEPTNNNIELTGNNVTYSVNDKTVTTPIVVKTGAIVTLDINSKSITVNNQTAITVENGGQLTIEGEGNVDTTGINSTSAPVVLNEGKTIINGGIFGTKSGKIGYTVQNGKMWQFGDLPDPYENKTRPELIVNGGTIHNDFMAAVTNNDGTVEINGGVYEGSSQDTVINTKNKRTTKVINRLKITGGTINRTTENGEIFLQGSALKNESYAEITGGCLNGAVKNFTNKNASASTNDADQIQPAHLAIRGGEFNGDVYAVNGITKESRLQATDVEITGGTFKGGIWVQMQDRQPNLFEKNPNANLQDMDLVDITGGTFDGDQSSITPFLNSESGCEMFNNIVGTSAKTSNSVASVSTDSSVIYFDNLQDAMNYAVRCDNTAAITLLKDIANDGDTYTICGENSLKLNRTITLQLDQHKIANTLGRTAIKTKGLHLAIENGTIETQAAEPTDNEAADAIAAFASTAEGSLTVDRNAYLKGEHAGIGVYGSEKDKTESYTVNVKTAVLEETSDVNSENSNAGLYVDGKSIDSQDNINVTVTDDAVVKGQTGIYAAGETKLEIYGGTLTGKNNGMVIRAGSLLVKGGIIESTSEQPTTSDSTGNDPAVSNAGIGVFPQSGENVNVNIEGGVIKGPTGVYFADVPMPKGTSIEAKISGGSIVGTHSEHNAIGSNNRGSAVSGNLKQIVYGGFFSNDVKQYLAESVNVKTNIQDQKHVGVVYGYFSSEDSALKQIDEAGYDIDGELQIIDNNKAMFVKGGAGFIGTGRKDGNDVLNRLAPLVKGDGAHWGDTEQGITDCSDNTLYAAFKAAKDDEQTGKSYQVTFAGKDEKSYSSNIRNVTKGDIVYFTPATQGADGDIPETDFQGRYMVDLTDESTQKIISETFVDVYKIILTADGTTVTGECDPVYTDKAGTDPGKIAKPDSFELAPGFNTIKWSEPIVSDDGYTIELTASGSSGSSNGSGNSSGSNGSGGSSSSSGSGNSGSSAAVTTPSSSNGSFSVSNKNAKAGDTVTVTPKPDEGYVVDEVTVTDKNGNTIDVKMNADGTYSFVMPEKAAQPVKVEVTFKQEAGAGDNPSAQFTDIVPGAWYQDAVNYAIENGLMEGTSATTFEPNTKTSRGMVVTILHRLEGTPSAAAAGFGDVASGQWYSDAVAWAAAHGIVTGYDNGNFGPNDIVTREQMAAILYRYASYKAYGTDAQANLTSYTDAGAISGYAESAMKWANAEGLITGTTTTTLSPAGDASRAEVATILMRFCEEVAK